jgi:D-3-phosphoglycerate dehydrogenase
MPATEAQLLAVVADLHAIIVGNDPLTLRVIEAAHQLKVISKYGAGVNNIAVEAATQHGIVVTYAPNQDAVADLTFGLMLSLARRICAADRRLRAGEWPRTVGGDVWRKTLGVVGTGRIGKAVIKRARGFEMEVLAHDIGPDPQAARELGFGYVPLDALLERSDFVTLHVPLTDETCGLVGRREIGLMKPGAYLINTARGGIVDEDALYEALRAGRLAGAALDAHAQEPPARGNPLLALDNLIVTPHMGADTRACLREMDLIAVENVLRVLRGEAPRFALNWAGRR